MSEELKRPPLSLHLSELWRANKERRQGNKLVDNMKTNPLSNGHPILVIPGFMASEVSTRPMRKLLIQLGYQVFDWGQGRNYARPVDLEALSKKNNSNIRADTQKSHNNRMESWGYICQKAGSIAHAINKTCDHLRGALSKSESAELCDMAISAF